MFPFFKLNVTVNKGFALNDSLSLKMIIKYNCIIITAYIINHKVKKGFMYFLNFPYNS